MSILYYFATFISGLFVGSFLNLVSDRIVKKESIFFGRSHCDHCKKTLSVRDLFPLFSYAFSLGKCRYCKKGLSWTYPFSELLTGFAFFGAAYLSKFFVSGSVTNFLSFILMAITFCFYIILLLTDMKYRLIPDRVVIPAIIFVLVFSMGLYGYSVLNTYSILNSDPFGKYLIDVGYVNLQAVNTAKMFGINLLTALSIAFFFWFLVFITKGRGMGGGDIRLGFLVGIFNGFPAGITAIFLSFIIGALYSIALIVLRRRTLKDTIPFGPFMIVGSILALIWGEQFWVWYTGIF